MLETPRKAQPRVEPGSDAEAVVSGWLSRFNAGLADQTQLRELFRQDCYWRDVVALTWKIETFEGHDRAVATLAAALQAMGARDFAIDRRRAPPILTDCAGEAVAEAILSFETSVGRAAGHVRLKCADVSDGRVEAWTLTTALDALTGYDVESERLRREEPVYQRDWRRPNWQDLRIQTQNYDDREPQVLVVGGGHAGLTAAAWLKALGIDALIVDKTGRIGDNWRHRYRNLKLHSPTDAVHFPFLSYPPTWPKYIPKDKIANWLEFYVEAMELNFWTATTFEGATYDTGDGRWLARVRRADGSIRQLRPHHIVMATSVSGTPNIPHMPTLESFKGTVLHSSQFDNAAQWRGRRALVIGTGTSGHDIAQDLHANGASVTMVQRSPTVIVSIEPSAHIYLDALYQGDGPSMDDRDMIATTLPLPLMKRTHQMLTVTARDNDRALHDGLAKAGFRLDFGEDDSGWPLRYFNRGGGYYFNVGASDLIVAGEIGLVQYADIARFDRAGAVKNDGKAIPADLVVLATGYKGYAALVERLFGTAVNERVGAIWGYDKATLELANMWTQTAQPGLWFSGGSFTQSRIYSKYLALQIKALEEGLVPPK